MLGTVLQDVTFMEDGNIVEMCIRDRIPVKFTPFTRPNILPQVLGSMALYNFKVSGAVLRNGLATRCLSKGTPAL